MFFLKRNCRHRIVCNNYVVFSTSGFKLKQQEISTSFWWLPFRRRYTNAQADTVTLKKYTLCKSPWNFGSSTISRIFHPEFIQPAIESRRAHVATFECLCQSYCPRFPCGNNFSKEWWDFLRRSSKPYTALFG